MFANRDEFSTSFFNLNSQIYSYSKYFPQCLKNMNTTEILDILREKWLSKKVPKTMPLSLARDVFMKIQKTLVTYCKNETADTQILFDLLKDFYSYI